MFPGALRGLQASEPSNITIRLLDRLGRGCADCENGGVPVSVSLSCPMLQRVVGVLMLVIGGKFATQLRLARSTHAEDNEGLPTMHVAGLSVGEEGMVNLGQQIPSANESWCGFVGDVKVDLPPGPNTRALEWLLQVNVKAEATNLLSFASAELLQPSLCQLPPARDDTRSLLAVGSQRRQDGPVV